MLGLQRVNIPG